MNRMVIALVAALVGAPAVARAQAQPPASEPAPTPVVPQVESRDVDANVGSQTDRPPGGSPADRRGSLDGERMRAAMAEADVAAVSRAAQLDELQRALGRIAKERGSTPRVRQLGSVVYNDAGEAHEEVQAIARRLGLGPLPGLTPDQESRVAELKKEPRGAELDRALVDAMQAAEREELGLLDDLLARQSDDHTRWLIDRAARSLRQADRAAAIERKAM